VRYFVAWNAMDDDAARLAATATAPNGATRPAYDVLRQQLPNFLR
jgi:hypothetical protein